MIDLESGRYPSADAPTLSFSHCASLPSRRVVQMNRMPIHNEWDWNEIAVTQPAAQSHTRHRVGCVCSAVFG
jgi:hypothetical protein